MVYTYIIIITKEQMHKGGLILLSLSKDSN
jgi:hypothetical protein